MTWITVHRTVETHGGTNTSPRQTIEAVVNVDLIHAIERLGPNRARLIWHGSSPRTSWDLNDTYDDIVARVLAASERS